MYSKRDVALRLVGLRREMEYGTESAVPDDWLLALFDVCQALELGDEQTMAVVGPRIWELINNVPLGVGR